MHENVIGIIKKINEIIVAATQSASKAIMASEIA